MRAVRFADSEALAANGEARPFFAQEQADEDVVVVKVEEGDNQLWGGWREGCWQGVRGSRCWR
jgi:hypothetical protein